MFYLVSTLRSKYYQHNEYHFLFIKNSQCLLLSYKTPKCFWKNLYISGSILNQCNIFKGQSGIKWVTKIFISFDPIICLKKIKRKKIVHRKYFLLGFHNTECCKQLIFWQGAFKLTVAYCQLKAASQNNKYKNYMVQSMRGCQGGMQTEMKDSKCMTNINERHGGESSLQITLKNSILNGNCKAETKNNCT